MGRVLGAVLMLAMLAGCAGQASNAPERPEKEGAEQTPKEVSSPTPEPSTPAPEVESVSADAAKAEAANEGLTVEQFNSVDNSTAYGEDLVTSLLSCQPEKYAQDHGTEAATKHAEELTLGLVLSEYPKNSNDPFKKQMEKEGVEPIYAEKGHDTVQAQLIDEGYTCSMAEISSH